MGGFRTDVCRTGDRRSRPRGVGWLRARRGSRTVLDWRSTGDGHLNCARSRCLQAPATLPVRCGRGCYGGGFQRAPVGSPGNTVEDSLAGVSSRTLEVA